MKPYREQSDIELIAACQQGNEQAWDLFVARYERLVYTIPLRYGLTRSEADDVFQAVWLALLKNLASIKQPERIAAWLVTTARRECWDRRRGADYERTHSVAPGTLTQSARLINEAEPEHIVERFEQNSYLQDALLRLEYRCRQLIWYLYQDPGQLSYKEVAARLEMKVGALGPTRARCLKKLRGLMESQA